MISALVLVCVSQVYTIRHAHAYSVRESPTAVVYRVRRGVVPKLVVPVAPRAAETPNIVVYYSAAYAPYVPTFAPRAVSRPVPRMRSVRYAPRAVYYGSACGPYGCPTQ